MKSKPKRNPTEQECYNCQIICNGCEEFYNKKAKTINNFSEHGFNKIQILELMEEFSERQVLDAGWEDLKNSGLDKPLELIQLSSNDEEIQKQPERPEIITMCGSTRFGDLMAIISWEFEKIGKIVLRVNYLPEWYCKINNLKENAHYADQEGLKQELDTLHFRKIDMCDIVYICNLDGYIGESTTNEINYAKSINKPIIYLQGNANEMTDTVITILFKLKDYQSNQ